MSLVTLERSSPSPHESENEDLLSTSSYEGFVARDHYAMCLSPRPFTSLGPGRSGDQLKIFSHLKKLFKIIRTEDMLRMAVELENHSFRRVTKYFVIITTNGHMGTEETIVLGTEQEGSTVRICLVLPLWRNTEIKLDGDGGFSVHTVDRHQVFKPSSVQSMWATLQMLYKSTKDAHTYNYYSGGLSHTWMSYYSVLLCSDGAILNEWNLTADVQSCRHDIYGDNSTSDTREDLLLKKRMILRLREVMLNQDLEEVTCRQLKNLVEMDVKFNLNEYSAFLDQQIFRILGQMERPSQIFDSLYLGSEWNASNLPELKDLGVKYILNISREIDNFYPEEFKYLNIKLYDVPTSQLIKHWDKTYTFIKEAMSSGKKVLVHCRMGISRSAATVTAFAMKEYKMSLNDALAHVKSKRAIVNPNEGFMQQLQAYEGILKARHNELWGKQAPPRPLPLYRSRSRSEPNLPDLINRSSCDDEPELSFLEEGGEALNSPNLLVTSSSHLDRDLADQATASSSSQLCPLSLPIDKSQTILNFLASLPNIAIEDDQGLGENMMCNSESGSGYSSPVSTPTDDNHLHGHYSRLTKEIRKSASKKEKEEGGGNEGALTNVKKEEVISEVVSPPVDEVDSLQPVPSEESRPQHDSISPISFTMTTERHQPVAEISQYQTEKAIGPSLSAPPPPPPEQCTNSLHSSEGAVLLPPPPEQCSPNSLRSSEGAPLPPEECSPSSLRSSEGAVLPPLPPSPVSLHSSQGAPLPTEQCSPISLHSSSQGAVSLKVMRSDSDMRVDMDYDMEVTENEIRLEEHKKPSNLLESKSDSAYELGASPTSTAATTTAGTNITATLDLPQSTQPQNLDTSGPIEVPQIYSVPERIKEIEEMNIQKAQSKSSSSSFEPVVLEKERLDPTPSEKHVRPDEESVLSMTRTSSGGQSISSSGDEELKLLSNTSSPRHSSLSPDPPLQRTNVMVDAHTASCIRFPSISPQQLSEPPLPSNEPPSLSSATTTAEEIVHLEPGAVKARVLDIERNKDERSISSDELSARRLSSPVPIRPASSGNVPETTCEAKNLRQHLSKQRRPSSDIIAQENVPHPVIVEPSRSQRRESTPPAFLSAWSKLIDSDVPSLPVQDLKKKFEDSDSVSVCSSNMGSSANSTTHSRTKLGGGGWGGKIYSKLRRSQSLRDAEFPGKKTGVHYRSRGKSSGNKVLNNDKVMMGRARTDSPCSQD